MEKKAHYEMWFFDLGEKPFHETYDSWDDAYTALIFMHANVTISAKIANGKTEEIAVYDDSFFEEAKELLKRSKKGPHLKTDKK